MTQKQKKKTVQDIGKAVQTLPESKREYILGFAEGMAYSGKNKRKEGDA